MNIQELEKMMIEKGLVVRAIPLEKTAIYEFSHKDEYPDGIIKYAESCKRDMLHVTSDNGNLSGKFVVAQEKGKSGIVRNWHKDDSEELKVYDNLQQIIDEFQDDSEHATTQNYLDHCETMKELSIAELVRAYDYINMLSQFIPSKNEVLDDLESITEPLLNIIRKLQISTECPRCGNELLKSDLPQYNSVCVSCDKNF